MQNLFSNTQILTGHSGAVYSICFDEKFIYSASADKFVVRWNLETGEQDPFAIKFNFAPYSVCLFNQNQFIAVGLSNGDLHFFDLVSRKEVKFYQQHTTGIFAISENNELKHLYVADASGNLSVWNSTTFELVIYLPFDCGKIRKIKTSKDGTKIFIASQDGFLRILDAVTFSEINSFHTHEGGATSILEVSNNELLSGGKDAHIKVWDPTMGLELKSIPAHNFVVYDLMSLNETTFVSASRDKTIKIWDLESMSVIQRIEQKNRGHKHSVNQLVKISDTQFASCSDDGTIIVWKSADQLR